MDANNIILIEEAALSVAQEKAWRKLQKALRKLEKENVYLIPYGTSYFPVNGNNFPGSTAEDYYEPDNPLSFINNRELQNFIASYGCIEIEAGNNECEIILDYKGALDLNA